MHGCSTCYKIYTRSDNLKRHQQLHGDSAMDQESVTAELESVNDYESVEESGNKTESEQE